VRTSPRFARGDVLRVGSWGHYAEHKGLDLLIDAVRACEGRVELRLAGGVVLPEYRKQLEERARGLPIVFDDAFAAHELAAHRVSDVHVFASGSRARESWGLVVDEAFALGLPVVLPNAGAFEERVGRHAAARLYEQGSSAALAAVLLELASDPARVAALAAAVPKRAQLERTGDDHARALLPLYAAACESGAPATDAVFDDARDLAEQASFDARVMGTA
jgi:glycosyltransferase involved in cell wall biosynthesis